MSNTVGIKEVTLAQAWSGTHAINVVGSAAGNARLSVYQPAVIRITDHPDDDGGTADNVDGMALFTSKAHGQPWLKDVGINHIISSDAAQFTDNTVIFPDFDYSTFE